jgi:hypothetical protein
MDANADDEEARPVVDGEAARVVLEAREAREAELRAQLLTAWQRRQQPVPHSTPVPVPVPAPAAMESPVTAPLAAPLVKSRWLQDDSDDDGGSAAARGPKRRRTAAVTARPLPRAAADDAAADKGSPGTHPGNDTPMSSATDRASRCLCHVRVYVSLGLTATWGATQARRRRRRRRHCRSP